MLEERTPAISDGVAGSAFGGAGSIGSNLLPVECGGSLVDTAADLVGLDWGGLSMGRVPRESGVAGEGTDNGAALSDVVRTLSADSS